MTGVAQNKSSAAHGSELPRLLAALRAWLPLVVSLLLLLAALFLWTRRLSGALEHSLPTAGLWLAGVALVGGSEFLRRCLTSDRGTFWVPKDARLRVACHWLGWLPVLVAWLTAAAISLPASPVLGLAGLWICLALAGAWAVRRQWTLFSQPGFFLVDRVQVGSAGADHEVATDDELSEEPEEDPNVVQQLVRRREADGGEWVTGTVRVAFAAGQKTAHAHVAFCPPFPATPTCEAEPVSGPDAELKVAQILPQGARFDLRLDELPGEPVDLVVEFAAHWQPAVES